MLHHLINVFQKKKKQKQKQKNLNPIKDIYLHGE